MEHGLELSKLEHQYQSTILKPKKNLQQMKNRPPSFLELIFLYCFDEMKTIMCPPCFFKMMHLRCIPTLPAGYDALGSAAYANS